MGWMLVYDSGGERREYPLGDGRTVLGHQPSCGIPLKGGVSRLHARVTVAGERVAIEDLDSVQGTRVNGSRVEREAGGTVLHDRDLIEVGDYSLQLLRVEAEFPPVPPPTPPTAKSPPATTPEAASREPGRANEPVVLTAIHRPRTQTAREPESFLSRLVAWLLRPFRNEPRPIKFYGPDGKRAYEMEAMFRKLLAPPSPEELEAHRCMPGWLKWLDTEIQDGVACAKVLYENNTENTYRDITFKLQIDGEMDKPNAGEGEFRIPARGGLIEPGFSCEVVAKIPLCHQELGISYSYGFVSAVRAFPTFREASPSNRKRHDQAPDRQ